MSFSLEPVKLKLKETCVIRYSLNVRNVDLHRDEILEKNLEGSADHISVVLIWYQAMFLEARHCNSGVTRSTIYLSKALGYLH